MTPTRRTILAGLSGLPGLALLYQTPAWAQGLPPETKILADKAAQALQALSAVKGRFEQTDARGGVTTGTIYLKRPGRARFAYDPPSGLTIVSDGHFVSVADSRLKTFDRYALSQTPLALFLAREVRLDQGVNITRADRVPGGFSVTARDGLRKTRGSITLEFADGEPAVLRGWSLVDAQGATTRVRLSGLSAAPGLDPALFAIRDPRPRPASRPM